MENDKINLQLAVVPESFLSEVREKLEKMESLLEEKSKDEINSQWLESSEVREILGISQKTWQTYRDERRIPFSQFGKKIYVKREDLEAFLNDHCINKRKV